MNGAGTLSARAYSDSAHKETMSHRTFTDANGRRWQVWDVLPHGAERRRQPSRREIPPTEQRSGVERRHPRDRRSAVLRLILVDRRMRRDRRRWGDRRSRVRRTNDAERRRRADRRAARRARAMLPGGLNEGWLCFEARDEKRRLTPIPEEWPDLSFEALRALVGQAVLVARRQWVEQADHQLDH